MNQNLWGTITPQSSLINFLLKHLENVVPVWEFLTVSIQTKIMVHANYLSMASEMPEQRQFRRAESSHKILGSVPNVIKKKLHVDHIVIGQ